MDATLQRHCAKFIYVVPEGLRELMSDISREVLRSQPEDIYTFIADYMDALLITRENARVASRLVNTITEIAITTIELLENVGVDYEDAERIAGIVQDVFRKHMQLQTSLKEAPVFIAEDLQEANVMQEIFDCVQIPEHLAEESALIIQNAFRKFRNRRERERDILRGMVDWRIAARSAIHLYRKTGVAKEDADRAATLIKAAYKGYFTRKLVKRIAQEAQEVQEVPEAAYVFDVVSDSEAPEVPESMGSADKAAKEVLSDLLTRTMTAMSPIETYLTSLEMETEIEEEGIPQEIPSDLVDFGKGRIPVALEESEDQQITDLPDETDDEKTEPLTTLDESAEEQPVTEATEPVSEVEDTAVVEEAAVEVVTAKEETAEVAETEAIATEPVEVEPEAVDEAAAGDATTDNEPATDAETTDIETTEPATTTDGEATATEAEDEA